MFSKRYFLIPILLLVFIFLFYSVYEDVKDKTIEKFNSEQLIIAKSASQGIKAFFSEHQSELMFLSQFPSIKNFDVYGEELLTNFYKNHSDQIEAITRVDSQGKILFTYPYNESTIGRDISYQKHVREIINTHKPVVSDVFMAVQGYLAIAFHVPIFNGQEYEGSIAILIAIDKLGKRYLENIKIAETGYAFLISENNIEIFCPTQGHTGESILNISQNDTSVIELIEKIKKVKEGASVCPTTIRKNMIQEKNT